MVALGALLMAVMTPQAHAKIMKDSDGDVMGVI